MRGSAHLMWRYNNKWLWAIPRVKYQGLLTHFIVSFLFLNDQQDKPGHGV